MDVNQHDRLDSSFKGFPLSAAPCAVDEIGQRRWNLFDDDLPYPIAVLRQAELEHNLRWMQAFAREHGVQIAPHGKTTMSPQIFRRQLALDAEDLQFASQEYHRPLDPHYPAHAHQRPLIRVHGPARRRFLHG